MSAKSELRNYLQTRYNKLIELQKSGQNVDQSIQEINNIAANFEIKLK